VCPSTTTLHNYSPFKKRYAATNLPPGKERRLRDECPYVFFE
jgi:hypothetical protein